MLMHSSDIEFYSIKLLGLWIRVLQKDFQNGKHFRGEISRFWKKRISKNKYSIKVIIAIFCIKYSIKVIIAMLYRDALEFGIALGNLISYLVMQVGVDKLICLNNFYMAHGVIDINLRNLGSVWLCFLFFISKYRTKIVLYFFMKVMSI